MNLLERIKHSFGDANNAPADPQHAQQVAAAVLMLEMEHADYNQDPDERAEIRNLLQAYFGLNGGDVDELLAAAEPQQREAVSLHSFLQVLNEHLSVEQKREVVEMLWRVAYADREIDAHEEHLLRDITELLFLPHREFIKAKLAVIGE